MTAPFTNNTLFKGESTGKMEKVHVSIEMISHSISQSIKVSQLRENEITIFINHPLTHTYPHTTHTR